MEIGYIGEFVILAETCNYMEAADQLFISQSSLSRHTKALEEELGVSLFDRSTRKVSLTSFGALLLPYAQRIAATRYEFDAALKNALNAEHGNIRIGTIPVMAQYQITDLISRFRKENPSFSLDIIEGDSLQLTKQLRSGQCDLAFLREGDMGDDEFNKIHYTTDTLCAFMSKNHPFAKRDFVRIEHLRNEPLMLLGKDTFMYSLCVKACTNAGFTPNVVLTNHRAANLLDLARKEVGIALLTKRPALPLVTDDLVSVEIEPRIITNINLAFPKDRPLSAGAKRFIGMVGAFL